jgi:hypothetical protein
MLEIDIEVDVRADWSEVQGLWRPEVVSEKRLRVLSSPYISLNID